MRIVLSIYGGSDKHEGIHYQRVLQRLGHDVFTVSTPSPESTENELTTYQGFDTRTRLSELQRLYGPIDFFLYVEPRGLIPSGLEKSPFPTAAVICDCHNDLISRQKLARFFDYVFLYHRNYLPAFTEHPKDHVQWMPFACDTEVIQPRGVERDIDVAFVGQLFGPTHERRRIIERLGQRWKLNPQRYYKQHEIPEIYSRAKIVLNLPLKDDLNFRTFEALSCGALLLTRRVANGQEVLFEEGKHFACFSNEIELEERISHYLAHPAERERIAAAGLQEVRKNHSLELRLRTLTEKLQGAPPLGAPVRAMEPSAVDRQYAWLYEYWRDANAGFQLARDAKRSERPWRHLTTPALKSVLRVMFR